MATSASRLRLKSPTALKAPTARRTRLMGKGTPAAAMKSAAHTAAYPFTCTQMSKPGSQALISATSHSVRSGALCRLEELYQGVFSSCHVHSYLPDVCLLSIAALAAMIPLG